MNDFQHHLSSSSRGVQQNKLTLNAHVSWCTRSYRQWEDHLHQRGRPGPLHAGRQHAVGQLRDQQRAPGEDHADAVRHAAAGGEPGAVRLLGGQVRRAAALLHDFPRAAEHQVSLTESPHDS